MQNTTIQDSDVGARALHTPYHALGGTRGARVPSWVKHRSVYRGEGRTTYLVETDHIESATGDLARLADAGWDVLIERVGASDSARVLLTQNDFAQAA